MRIFLALAALIFGCGADLRTPRDPAAGEPAVRLATFNVNYGLRGDPGTVAALREAAADIILLQETTPAWELALRGEFSQTHPHIGFLHHQAAGGLGVLSRYPVLETEILEPTVGWFPAWRAVFDTPVGPLQVLQVHLRPQVSDGGSFVWGYLTTDAIRRDELRDLVKRIDPALPTAVVGDFNAEPGDDALDWLAERGYASALAQYAPDATTWRWPTTFMTLRGTLDHIFLDARLDALSAQVIRKGRSDHFPVVSTVIKRGAPLPEG